MAPFAFDACQCWVGSGWLTGLIEAGNSCAGGAGFIPALIGALAARQQAAQSLGPSLRPPLLDRVAIRVLDDNQLVSFVPNEQRDGLRIEHGAPMDLEAEPRTWLMGEWGLSLHAQSWLGDQSRQVLVDFGYTPEVLLNNMAMYGMDASGLDALVLSHGHFDHFGGLVGFLTAMQASLRPGTPFFVGGEDAFCRRRYGAGRDGNLGALDRNTILQSGLTLMKADGPALLAGHGFTTGRIGQTSFEKPLVPTRMIVGIQDGFGCFADELAASKNTGSYIDDDFDHELATCFAVRGRGLVVLTSCSHRGVINTVRQAQAASGIDRVLAVIGGFHIVHPLGDDVIDATLDAFRELDPAWIIPGHCTGERFYERARAAFGSRVIHSSVGDRYVFEA